MERRIVGDARFVFDLAWPSLGPRKSRNSTESGNLARIGGVSGAGPAPFRGRETALRASNLADSGPLARDFPAPPSQLPAAATLPPCALPAARLSPPQALPAATGLDLLRAELGLFAGCEQGRRGGPA